MNNRILFINKYFVSVIFALFFVNTYSQTANYDILINKVVKHQALKSASISLYAENIISGKPIIDYNSHLSLVPASVMKIIPTAIALELLGPDKKFSTDLAYSGEINDDGVLNGNIYIIAKGDPCLDSRFFANHYNKNLPLINLWLSEIQKLGIKKINGDIVSDISYFGTIDIPRRWLWEDVANYYANPGSALCFRDNMYELHFKTGAKDKASTSITKIIPDDLGLTFKNEVLSSSTVWDDAYIFYTNDPNVLTVKGSLRWKKENFIIKGSLPQPEMYLMKSLIDKIQTSGISFNGDAKIQSDNNPQIKRKVFYTTYSPKLSDIVSIVNIKSNNLFAEMLAHHIEKHTNKSYAEAVNDFFTSKDIKASGLYIDDACGLSRLNSLNSYHLVQLLKYMKYKSKNSEVFVQSLPISGKTGTLKNYCLGTKAIGRVYAKSGSMTRVRAYAGYIKDLNDNEIIFCFIVNNFDCKNSMIKNIFENVFVDIVTKEYK